MLASIASFFVLATLFSVFANQAAAKTANFFDPPCLPQSLTLTTSSSTAAATCGDLVTIEIKVSNSFTDLLGLQYSVGWDQNKLTYISHTVLPIGAGSPSGDPFIGAGNTANGQLTYTWSSPGADQDLPDGTTILTLTMRAKGSSGTAVVSVTETPLSTEVTDKNLCSGSATAVNNASIALSPISCLITGAGLVCTNSTGNTYSGPMGGTYSWSISGSGSINGSGTGQTVVVDAGSACNGSFILSLVYTDANGCVANCDKTVTVVDNAAPTADVMPPMGPYACYANIPVPNILEVTGETDNCGGAVTVTWISDSANPGCTGTVVRTYRLTDGCSNSGDITQNISINDNVAPVLINPLADCSSLNISNVNECLSAAALFNAATLQGAVAALYSDNCAGPVTALLTGTAPGGSNSDCSWSFTYTYTISDACSNSTTCTVTRSGGDTQTPSLINPMIGCASLNMTNMNLSLAAASAFDPITLQGAVALLYNDNCDASVTATWTSTTPGGGNSDCGWTFTYHFSIVDNCSNATTCSVTYSGLYGKVTNTDTGEFFCSIQSAIDDAQTLNGHTIQVSAGTYAENITVNKSLDIRGPNYNISPNTGMRVAEAVIVPASTNTSNGAIVTITVANVTFRGFTLDGDNTSLVNSGVGLGGVYGLSNDAARGVFVNANGVSGITISNNIARKLENGIRVEQTTNFFASGGPAQFSTGIVIDDNKVEDVRGTGIRLGNSMFAKVTNNTVTNAETGIAFSSFRIKDMGNAVDRVVQGNTISARFAGIWVNLFHTSPYALNNNAITVAPAAPGDANPGYAARTTWNGILYSTVSAPQNFTNQTNLPLVATPEYWTCNNNTIDGAGLEPTSTGHGYWLYYVDNNRDGSNVDHYGQISGGSVSNVAIGIFLKNKDTDPATGFGTSAVGTHAGISGVAFSLNSGGTAIKLKDDATWTTSNPAPLINKRTVALNLGAGVTVSNGAKGILLDYPDPATPGFTPYDALTGATLNNITFSGQTGNYVEMLEYNRDLDGTSASFDGNTGGTATVTQLYAIENKILHEIDDSDLGYVSVRSATTSVTQTSYSNPATTTPSVQRAINALGSAGTVNVESGATAYTGGADASGKDVTLNPGSSPGCVTITGNMTLNSGDALHMEINGTTACTSYDQFTVNGTVTLGGASLDLSLGYGPVVGEQYTLISNDGVDPVSGTFAQGNSVTVGGYDFSINYAGGDGNDVVLSVCLSVQNTDTGEYFCTIQAAIDDAQTLDGHTLVLHAPNFNEQVLVNKSLTIVSAGPGQSVIDFTGVVSGKPTLFDISKPGVTIDNLKFRVDMTKLNSAIIASAADIDNLTVKNNTIEAYGSSAAASFGSYGNRNAISINYGGPINYRVAVGGVDNVLVQNNSVSGVVNDGFGQARFFRSGAALDEGGGTFTLNTMQTINHDVLVRFGGNGDINITNNNLNGGGVELSDMNAGAGTLTVSGNTFNAAFANVSAPGSAVLRVKNNQTFRPTVVSGNTFSNHEWAVSLENYNTVTLDNNTFTPLAGSTTFHHVAINTKSISTNSASIVQTTIDGTLTKNTFNWSGVAGGTALSFHNHDSDAASFGTFTIGTAANENNFNAGIGTFIRLDDQTGSSSASTFPNYTALIGSGPGALTTMACWTPDINVQNNKFDVGAGLQLPSAMNLSQRTALEANLYHRLDNSCLGNLIFFYPVHNLTQNTYYLTIQAGVNAANANDVIECEEYTFREKVNIDKTLTLQGVNETNTVIDGAGLGNGSGITVANGVTNVHIEKFTIKNHAGTSPNGFGGIYAPGGNSGLNVQYCTIKDNVGCSGFYANGPIDGLTLNDLDVSGHTNTFGAARGIVIWNGFKENITITNCEVYNNNCCGIELQDGTASGVTMTGNNVHDNGDNGIGLSGLKGGTGPNLISGNTVTNNGRFGIEVKNPSGNGLSSGTGSIVVQNNTVTLAATAGMNNRDHAGIAVFRRAFTTGNPEGYPNIPSGVVVQNNTVSGYKQLNPGSTDKGYGIVIEGTNHDVLGNTVSNCDFGIQEQGGAHPNPNYVPDNAGDGDQAPGMSASYFGRGNAPVACGNSVSGNMYSGNTIDFNSVTGSGSFNMVTNTNTGELFCSIQAAINDPNTLNGHTIVASAGSYYEDIIVNKEVSIRGPNYSVSPNTGMRTAEAIVYPATSDVDVREIFHVAADNVTVDGFTIDGDNPTLTSGYLGTNGADLDAAEGVTVYETGINNLTVSNNILKNLSYFGVTLYDYPAGVPSSGHLISDNKFQDFGTYDAASGIDFWGGGVLLYNNQYARVVNNVMTNVRAGVQTGNFYLANPGDAAYQVIANNTMQVRRRGIFHNLSYSSASAYTLSNNTITGIVNANETMWDGILLSSLSVPSTSQNNTIDGGAISNPSEGYEVWNVKSTSPALITGGSVTGVSTGVFVNNFEGYNSDAPDGGHATIEGLSVTPKLAGVGIRVLDSPSSTSHAAVSATVQNDCEIVQSGISGTGVSVEGAHASADVKDNDASIHGFAYGIAVNAGSATVHHNHIYGNAVGILFFSGGTGTVHTNKFYDGTTRNDKDLKAEASAGAITASPDNWFAGNFFGVENLSALNIDATLNYWNAASGPGPVAVGSGAWVSPMVNYCPWLNGIPVALGGAGMPTSPAVTILVTETSGTTANDGRICAGSSVTMDATTPTATGYSWSPGGATTPSITVAPGSTTTYTVDVTFAGCSVMDDQQIIVDPMPSATITAPAMVCGNSTGNTASVPDAGVGATYVWNITNAAITAGAGTNSITFTAGISGSITYDITITSPYNCTSMGNASTIIDNIPPTITCVAPVSVNTDAGLCTAVVNGIAPASVGDNCSYTVAYLISGATTGSGSNDASGTVFAVGVSTVAYTITDASGNTANCSFAVTVTDDQLPSISCPGPVTVGILDPRDPYATGYATTSDNCGPVTLTFNDDRSGLTGCNATGIIVRTFTAKDASNNTVTCQQTVTVQDLTAPVMTTCPSNMTVPNDPGLCSAIVNYSCPTAADQGYFQGFENAAYVSGSYTNQPSTDWNDYNSALTRAASGTDGITSKTGSAHGVINSTAMPAPPYQATGAFNRLGGYSPVFGTGFRTVQDIYIDLSDPAVLANTYGWDLSTAASNQANAHRRDFIFHSASNAVGEVLIGASNGTNFTRRNDLASINHYTITSSGWYTFEWVFRDNAGVLAVDLNLRGAGGALLWTQTLSDPSDLIASQVGGNRYMWFTFLEVGKLPIDNSLLERNVPVACVPPSGSTFLVGPATTVTSTAVDACMNTSSCSFTVTVEDNEPPTITCAVPAASYNADPMTCTYTVVGTALNPAVTGDNCGVATVVNNYNNTATLAGAVFPVGTTPVVWTVTDVHGLTATCNYNVMVVDNQQPSITCPGAVTVGILDPRDPYATGYATASDNCGATTVTFNDDRSGLTACNATGIILRTFTAKDASNNAVTCQQTVTVQDLTPPVMTSCPSNMTVPADPGLCAATVNFACPTAADLGYFQGFENAAYLSGDYTNQPSTDWNDYSSALTRVTSGADGVSSKTGAAHGVINSTSIPAAPFNYTGAFGRLGGYSPVFGTGFRTAQDIYINLNDPAVLANTYGWDLSTAASNQANAHRRDFVFHSASNASGEVLIGASNGSNFTRRNDLASINHYTITSSGWYTFEWVFRDNAGVLAVDLNLRNAGGALLWTQTLSDPSDMIATVVGGNRYMWFTFLEVDKLAIDNSLLERNVAVACAPPSGSVFNVGTTTTVTSSGVDACGNPVSCSFTVTVTDNQDPVITCPTPAASYHMDAGECHATLSFTATATDNCGVASIKYYVGVTEIVFPYDFPVGTTTVTATATDVNGRTKSCMFDVVVVDNQDPVITCPMPAASYNMDAGQCKATLSFTATATDNCGVASIKYYVGMTEIAFPYDFLVGTTTVTATATDVNGRTKSCTFDVVVVDNQPPTITCPASISVNADPDACTYTIVGTAYNATGISDNCGIASTAYSTVSGTVTPSTGTTLAGAVLNGGANVIEWKTTDVNGVMSTCQFTLTVNPCTTVAGTLYWRGPAMSTTGVAQAMVYLSGDATDTDGPTPVAGTYSLTGNAGSNFTVTPEKTINMYNGVNVGDATAIQQHLTGISTITDFFRLVAADVNRSNTISTLDAVILRQAILGNPAAQNILNTTKSWRFVSSDFAYPNPAGPYTLPIFPETRTITASAINQDFYGVKVADVAEGANPALGPEGQADPIVWGVVNRKIQSGETVEMTFSVRNFNDIAAYQFALGFDPEILEFVELEVLTDLLPINAEGNFGLYNIEAGELRAAFSVEQGYNLPSTTPVFRLRFTALASGYKISDLIHIDQEVMPAVAFNSELLTLGVELEFLEEVVNDVADPASGKKMELMQNRPNPFGDQTVIGFVLPESCEAKLRVYDINGNELLLINRNYPAGYSEETIYVDPKQTGGVLFCELSSPYGILVRKMVLVR